MSINKQSTTTGMTHTEAWQLDSIGKMFYDFLNKQASSVVSLYTKIRSHITSQPFVINYIRMAPYILRYRWRLLGAILVSLPIGMMNATIAWTLKPFMDAVTTGTSTHNFNTFLPTLIVCFGVAQGLLNFASAYWNNWVSRKIANDVKLVLFEKLTTNDSGFFDRNTSGSIQTRFNNDVNTACQGLVADFMFFMTRIISSIALIGVLIYNSIALSSIAVAMLFATLIPLRNIRKRVLGTTSETVHIEGAMATHYNETFHGNRVISSYNLSQYQTNRFNHSLSTIFKLGMKIVKKTAMISPLMHAITSTGMAIVIWSGMTLIHTKQITPGNLASFVVALGMLYEPLKSIGAQFKSIIDSMLAIDRVWEQLESIPAVKSRENAQVIDCTPSTIEFRGVSFGYLPNRPVLECINLKVQVGQTVAIVGASGGGKTTFASLLCRFYDVTHGGIYIDNIDIRNIDLASLRSQIGVVFQDNFLFGGSIRDNIVLDQKHVSETQLKKVVKEACLAEFIDTLEDGIDTQIGERGILLSGGQRQRIGIARAFMKNAPIVILDEATSSLDNKSEAVVQRAIENLTKNRTVFIIAHRLSTIKHADRILVFDKGSIVEDGEHDALMNKPNGIYAGLYQQDPVIANFA